MGIVLLLAMLFVRPLAPSRAFCVIPLLLFLSLGCGSPHQKPKRGIISPVPMAKLIDGLQLRSEGPNCWNGALLKAGLIKSVRFVPKAEYWFWMNSPYCKEVVPSQNKKVGDLGSMFWSGKGHYHSFVYLNQDYVFSKNSPDPKYPYQVQKFEEMFNPEFQDQARSCHADKGFQVGEGQSLQGVGPCPYRIVFHRCRPIENNFYRGDAKLQAWDRRLKSLEKKVFDWVSRKNAMNPEDYAEVLQRLHEIHREVRGQLEAKTASDLGGPSSAFVLQSMEFRVLGLILSDNKFGSLRPDLGPIINEAYQLQDSKKSLFKPSNEGTL